MWILPTNMHNEFLASAQAGECSTWELSELSEIASTSLMWKSKPFAASTWRLRWKRVWWLQRLFGQTLKPSMHGPFVDWWTASLAAIPANHLAMQGNAGAPTTPGTFGRILNTSQTQFDLFGHSLKTSKDILASDSPKFSEAWKIWVTQLRREYSRRLSWGRHRYGNASLSLRLSTLDVCGNAWPTPKAGESNNYQTNYDREKIPMLELAVKMWATPTCFDETEIVRPYQQIKETAAKTDAGCINLREQIFYQEMTASRKADTPKMWPTPAARDEKDGNSMEHLTKTSKNRNHLDQLPNALKIYGGQQGPANHNTNGKAQELLNPAWVAQLMGTTLGEIYFGCSETG
jgi:hypothetical protein